MNNAYRAGIPHDRGPSWYGHIDGRTPENVGMGGAVHAWSSAPNLAALVASSGLSAEEIKARLAQQGYGEGIIQRLTNGGPLPRVVSSRITAVLGLRHTQARNEE
jgi:hypothetical protein